MLIVCLILFIIIVKMSFYCTDLYRENCIYLSKTKKLNRNIDDLKMEKKSLKNRIEYLELYGNKLN